MIHPLAEFLYGLFLKTYSELILGDWQSKGLVKKKVMFAFTPTTLLG